MLKTKIIKKKKTLKTTRDGHCAPPQTTLVLSFRKIFGQELNTEIIFQNLVQASWSIIDTVASFSDLRIFRN